VGNFPNLICWVNAASFLPKREKKLMIALKKTIKQAFEFTNVQLGKSL
jgi:hypothetical protein